MSFARGGHAVANAPPCWPALGTIPSPDRLPGRHSLVASGTQVKEDFVDRDSSAYPHTSEVVAPRNVGADPLVSRRVVAMVVCRAVSAQLTIETGKREA